MSVRKYRRIANTPGEQKKSWIIAGKEVDRIVVGYRFQDLSIKSFKAERCKQGSIKWSVFFCMQLLVVRMMDDSCSYDEDAPITQMVDSDTDACAKTCDGSRPVVANDY